MVGPQSHGRWLARTAAWGSASALALACTVMAAPSTSAVLIERPTSIDQIATQAGISTWCEGGEVYALVYYTMKSGTSWSLGDGSMFPGAQMVDVVPAGSSTPIGYSIGGVNYPEGVPQVWLMNDTDWVHTLQEGDQVNVHYGDNVTVSATLDCSAPSAVFRFWSPRFNNAHFFTTSFDEAEHIRESDPNWTYEGVAFDAEPATAGTCVTGAPVYRFYSTVFQSHFYTQDAAEKAHIIAADHNWTYEGVAYCAAATEVAGTTALYRFWSPVYGKHFFTADAAEAVHILAVDRAWTYEGVAYYVVPAGAT